MSRRTVDARPVMDRVIDKLVVGDYCWDFDGTHNEQGESDRVHRIIYLALRGAIPVGLTLDHLCHNRGCCRPSHLEPVTQRKNQRRGIKGVLTTHCPQGHEYTPENTETWRGRRSCRTCKRARGRLIDWHRQTAPERRAVLRAAGARYAAKRRALRGAA